MGKLKEIMEKRGVSVAGLRRAMEMNGHKVSYPTVHALYSADKFPDYVPVGRLKAICRVLQISTDVLLEDD